MPFTKINTSFDNLRQETGFFADDFIYQPIPPNHIDIFSHITDSLKTLSNENVQKQACEIIYSLYRVINDLNITEQFTNHLAKLHLTEQEDKTALLEWNFKNFRFGFTIEPDENKTSYYHVSQDHTTSKYSMNTEKICSRINKTIEYVVSYVLANT
jgi:hypothetical protein